ncbi:histidine phosphatase family protein [Cereibacter changlensis]|uniref:histidine phosphatase family protein n=1 Tax=Cereibacter changlensis TaxID=402884 RepID=UPI00403323FE
MLAPSPAPAAPPNPLAEALSLPIRKVAGLAERNWGAWEGLPRHRLHRAETPPRGEGPVAFRARVEAALPAIEGPTPILVIAHSGIARELHALIGAGAFQRPQNAQLFLWSPDGTGRWQAEALNHTEPSSSCHRPVAPPR